MIQIISAIDFNHSKFSDIGAVGLHYGQPNSIYRIPGRLALELEYIFNTDKKENFNQVIFGSAQDVMLSFDRFYLGAGIGIYIRSRIDSRIGSAFTFGEKIFLGYSFGSFNTEVFLKHYSNGTLTTTNSGFNFLGMRVGYSF
ncbi:hypothetical protein CQA49_09435 [Helicobacter sp. MIT 00-7814]|nr:hypothetical protein CQA49_09435 [Helicobacter sp. MIT 00-7814]RDU51637.1 hypothetical protein CQA37_09480 [Helicobacter sp. MIT 99-10781]